jgi:uncharacterized protein
VRLRLTPRETSFYTMFATSADNLVTATHLLKEFLAGDPEGRVEIATRMREAEHVGDSATHAILDELNSSFITPFDREDIYRLASTLDDVMDAMEAAVDFVVLYKVDELPPEVTAQIDVLDRAADLTAKAMRRLRSMRDLSEYWIEANRLENEADVIYRRSLARLFGGEYDALTVLKLKDVIDAFEEAADGFERVANTVHSIATKES